MKKLILVLIALTFIFIACQSKEATAMPGLKQWQLQWTANTEADLDGYYLYWRTATGAFNDTNRLRCAKTATSQLLTGVVPNNTILALTAIDVSLNESDFSTTVPFAKDGTACSSPGGVAVVPVP